MGSDVIDIGMVLSACALSPTGFQWRVFKEMNGTTAWRDLTDTEAADLKTEAGVSQSAFNTEAASTLGTYHTGMNQTAKTAFWKQVDLKVGATP